MNDLSPAEFIQLDDYRPEPPTNRYTKAIACALILPALAVFWAWVL